MVEGALEVSTERVAGIPVVRAIGEIDAATAARLSLALEVVHSDPTAIADLSETTFIDSSGLSVLIDAQKKMGVGGGELRLVISHPHILRVLSVTGLTESFSIFESLEAAIK